MGNGLTGNQESREGDQPIRVRIMQALVLLLALALPLDQLGFHVLISWKPALIVSVTVIALVAATTFSGRSRAMPTCNWVAWLLLATFLCAAMASIVVARDVVRATRLTGALLLNALAFSALSRSFLDRRNVEAFAVGTVAASLLMSIYGLMQYVYGIGQVHYWRSVPRPTGLFGDPNYFANYLLSTIPLTAVVASTGRLGPRRRALTLLASLATICSAATVVLTLSRGAWLGLFVETAVFLLWDPLLRRKALRMAPVIVLLMAIADGLPVTDHVLHRLEDLAPTASVNAERMQIYLAGLRMVAAHPVLGVGMGNFLNQSTAFNPKLDRPTIGHNVFLEWAAEAGIIAGVAFVGFVAMTALYGVRSVRRLRAMKRHAQASVLIGSLAALAGLVVQAMTISSFYFLHNWVVMALIMGLSCSTVIRGTHSPCPAERSGQLGDSLA